MQLDPDLTVVLGALGRAAASPVPGWAEPGTTWFEAATPHGALRLCLSEASGPAAHAAAAALALERAAQPLAALDGWLGGEAPDWRWQPAGAAAHPQASMLRLPWRDHGHQLLLPWAWARAHPAPPESLADEIRWPSIEAELCIDRLHLCAAEVAELEPGGAVLLPSSMREGWTGRLRAAGEDGDGAEAGVAVDLRDLHSPRLAGAAAGDAPGLVGGRPCEVRVELAWAVPAQALAGWDAEGLGAAMAPDLSASLWQLASGREPARCLARGRLLPWGDGWALGIEAVGELGHVRDDRVACID